MSDDPGHHTEHPLSDAVHENPPNWKDWVGLGGMLITVGVMFIQGGRVLERLDAAGVQLAAVAASVTVLNNDLGAVRLDLARQRGVDDVHTEKLLSHQSALNGIGERMSMIERADRMDRGARR